MASWVTTVGIVLVFLLVLSSVIAAARLRYWRCLALAVVAFTLRSALVWQGYVS